MKTTTIGTVRRVDESVGRGLVTLLMRFGLMIVQTSGEAFRFSGVALRSVCWFMARRSA